MKNGGSGFAEGTRKAQAVLAEIRAAAPQPAPRLTGRSAHGLGPIVPEVLASVGTDHHPFDRLVRWIDSWAAAHTDHLCLVQRGTSARPQCATSEEFIAYEDLAHAMTTSVVIVSHGGPATIMDARACGRLPIVVPRRSDLGEHVDDHQIRFSRWMARRHQVILAETEHELHHELDTAIGDPASVRVDPHGPDIEASVRRFAALVDGLLEGPKRP